MNSPEHSGDVICWGDQTSPGVWSRERTKIQMDVESQHINCVFCVPIDRAVRCRRSDAPAHSDLFA